MQRSGGFHFFEPSKKPVRKVIVFTMPNNHNQPEPPDNTPTPGCRPTLYTLHENEGKIMRALHSGRDPRSVAAQYGLRKDELFQLVLKRAA